MAENRFWRSTIRNCITISKQIDDNSDDDDNNNRGDDKSDNVGGSDNNNDVDDDDNNNTKHSRRKYRIQRNSMQTESENPTNSLNVKTKQV